MGQGLEVCLKARSRTVLAGVRPGSERGQAQVRANYPTGSGICPSGMGTRAVRIACGPSLLLWPLLLLLPLSSKAGVPSSSKVPGVAPRRPEPQQGWKPSALRHQDSVSGAEGPFESQWVGDGWRL